MEWSWLCTYPVYDNSVVTFMKVVLHSQTRDDGSFALTK